MRHLILALGVVWICPTLAQQSVDYRVEEHVFNAGGHPLGGTVPTSAGFQISLDALGDGITGTSLAGTSFRVDGAFVSAYTPPGEILALRFTDALTLVWNPERSVGHYNIYRGGVGSFLPDYGTCSQPPVFQTTTTDGSAPSPGQGFFYLVTAENRLREEGTKGFDSGGNERTGTVCP